MRIALSLVATLALAGAGCTPTSSGTTGAPAASSSAREPLVATSADTWPDAPPIGIPISSANVGQVVNPARAKKYAGPSGTVRGVIRIEGDAPPDTPYHFPPKCGEAAATYGKIFRVGQDKAVADVLVAINFEGHYVPETEPAQTISIKGCAFNTRTVAVTYGQRLDVLNRETSADPYMPYLDGAKAKATLVAVPQGEAVKLYPTEPKAHYLLRDELPRPFMIADVFVLAYATHAVTGLDGKYEIKNVPVGKATINAYLPAIDATVTKQVDVAAGDNAVDLTLTFKATAPASSASAKPSASAAPAKPPQKNP